MNPSTALATVLVDELVRNQVTEVVLAPGSRNAPLSLALHAADSAGRLRLHVRVDERSAGFLALGLARAGGQPVPVVTTSGTAAVNLHPAVVEAHHGGVPLVALTADRPAELQGVGANQSIDQVDLFGRAVRAAVAVPAAENRTGQNAVWRSMVSRIIATARGSVTGTPGPVHLDVAFREPLLPGGDDRWPEDLTGRPEGAPWTAVAAAPPADLETGGTGLPIDTRPRTLVLLGDCSRDTAIAARTVAARYGWPLVSEPVVDSGLEPPAVDAGGLVLGVSDWVSAHRPDRVLLVGRPTLSRAATALLSRSDVEMVVVGGDDRWPDPSRRAARLLGVDWLHRVARSPAAAGDAAHGDLALLTDWRRAGVRARRAVDAVLAAEPALTGPSLARELVAALPESALLVLGSSNAVRDVATGAAVRPGVRLLTNRGAAGIDGMVSTAVGAALAARRHTWALLGDLTFLHDGNGLLIGPGEPRPDLTIVVNNDDGGGIFSVLEQGAPAYADAFERVFGTPHGADLASLCAATGTGYTLAQTAAEVRAAVTPRPGITVVEVRTDRFGRRALDLRLRDAVRAALMR